MPHARHPPDPDARLRATAAGTHVVQVRGPLMPHVLVAGKWHPSGLAMLEAEPHAPDHPLRAPSNVILTPHGAGLSRQSADQIAVSLAQNVLGFFAGSLDPSVIVNKDALS